MNETHVTLIGNVAGEIRSSTTAQGVPMARFRLVVSPRRFDRENNQWTNREPSYYTVITWRRLAENTLSSVEKGDPLVVSGRLNVREYQRDNRWHTNVEVEATSLGHDLTRGTSQFTRFTRREGDVDHIPAPPAETGSPPAQAA